MKHLFLISLLVFTFITSFASYGKAAPVPSSIDFQNYCNNTDTMSNKIRIKTGSSSFTAILSDNITATAFKALLPMTINMTGLNGNEKYFNLSGNLPANASNPSTIKTGDLMIYGANTLVLFYKTFSTSYSYTNLGRIENATGLAAAIGNGNVTVTFEVQ